MTTEELITYYVDLLIMQYHSQGRARGTVEAYVGQVVADQIGTKVRDAYDLDTAVEKQLDVLASYVGAQRNVKGLDLSRSYMALPYYADPAPDAYAGLRVYGDTSENFFARYNDFKNSYALNDSELRKLIRLRIALNRSDYSLKDIDAIMYEFFVNDCSIVDTGNMEITYAFNPASTDPFIKIAIFTNSLPKPAGVNVVITGV